MKNRLLIACSFVFFATLLTAKAQQYGGFNYTTDGSVVTITGYYGSSSSVTIPSVISNLPVTSITGNAFYGCQFLIMTIPGSITSIGDRAFSYCSALRTLTISNGVTAIGNFVCIQCPSLTSVTIPSSVTSIGTGPFSGCTGLQAIGVDPLSTNFSSVDGVLCDIHQTTLIQYPSGRSGAYTISNSIISIESYAFQDSAGLTTVTIPDSVTSIGDWAFNYCHSLTKVTIGRNVASLGYAAFIYCPNLSGVYFRGNPPSLSFDVFYSDTLATMFYTPGTVGWAATFGGLPAMLWNPQVQAGGGNFGIQGNIFGFTISGTSNLVVAVEACTNLKNPVWTVVGTTTLTNGSSYFSDSHWTNYLRRLYRLTSP